MPTPSLHLAALTIAVSAMPGVAGAGDLRINGSGSALSAMKPLVAAFEARRPEVRVTMTRPLGTSGAITAAQAGALDLAVISRALSPDEEARGLRGSRYGTTPLAVVAHREVSQASVKVSELEALYQGRTKSWPGGEPIRIILRPETETNTKLLRSLSPGLDAAERAARREPFAVIAITDPESDELLVKTPGSLGLAALSSVLVERLSLRILSLDGVAPSVEAIERGAYPLRKEVVFVTHRAPSAAAKAFLAFASSAEGRALAARYGVVTGSAGNNR